MIGDVTNGWKMTSLVAAESLRSQLHQGEKLMILMCLTVGITTSNVANGRKQKITQSQPSSSSLVLSESIKGYRGPTIASGRYARSQSMLHRRPSILPAPAEWQRLSAYRPCPVHSPLGLKLHGPAGLAYNYNKLWLLNTLNAPHR